MLDIQARHVLIASRQAVKSTKAATVRTQLAALSNRQNKKEMPSSKKGSGTVRKAAEISTTTKADSLVGRQDFSSIEEGMTIRS